MNTVFFLICIVQICYGSLPNFVFIIADDLGWNDVGYHEATNAYTPTIDSLKSDGLELNRFYVYQMCAPTRSSMWTGHYTHNNRMQNGVGLTSNMVCGIDQLSAEGTPNEPIWMKRLWFTQRLKSCQNYENHLIGKWHCGFFKWDHMPMFRGFDSFLGFYRGTLDYFDFTNNGILDLQEDYFPKEPEIGDYSTYVFADRAIEIIKEKAESNDDTPFTLTVAFNAPHSPTHPIQPYRSEVLEMRDFSGDGNRRVNYASMIRAMDDRTNDIVNTLKEMTINGESIWDNTWLWWFSDNGPVITTGSAYPLRGAKSTLFEGGSRVPAFVTGGLLPDELRGQRTDYLLHVTDIAPTICAQSESDCADLEMDGIDLTNLLQNNGGDLSELEERTLILNVNPVNCDGMYQYEEVCGGIIRDFGEDGIWKAVIGNQINGGTASYGWNPLGSQPTLPDPTVTCNGMQPMFLRNRHSQRHFMETECAANNRVCLFNLTADPCEYENLRHGPQYADILEMLMAELVTEYKNQLAPFFQVCDTSSLMSEIAMEAGGYIPWANEYHNDSRYDLDNTLEHEDICPLEPVEPMEDSKSKSRGKKSSKGKTVEEQIENYMNKS